MMTMDQLEYGIVKYGTPLYVFDLEEITKTVSELRSKTNGIAKICFAMKANPFLTGKMAELTDRIEVCSVGEYEICRRQQIPAEKMLISGVLKERTELEKIISKNHDACTYTVESLDQFCSIAEWCRIHKEPLRIFLRLTSGNQFGIDEKMVKNLISVRDSYPLIKIQGLQFYSGPQKRSIDIIRRELQELDQLLQDIEEMYGFTINELEYGPGIEMPYFKGQPDRRSEDINELCRMIREMNWKGHVTLEMGRLLVGTAGYYLTCIRDLKTNNDKNYCIVDGGIHQIHYDGQIKGLYQPYLRVSPQRDTGETEEWTVCGSLCTDNDILINKLSVQELKLGDVLIFQRAGAYAMTEGMALFLSHALPKVAVFSKMSGWRLIRPEQPTYLWNMERNTDDGDIDSYFRGN